ncbi:MAG: thermonuclease family protein [bacterium]
MVALLTAAASAETRIVDGDTLDVDGIRIRLNGIDAPEFGQDCGNWQCGKAALAELVELVGNVTPACKPLGEDGYGRIIATCVVGGRDIGKEMARQGLAWAFVKYSDVYMPEEALARASGLGIWGYDSLPAWDYRAKKWESALQAAPTGCPIKGNISGNGKIYHAPWSPWYAKTRIDTSKGERWFCSEAEAVAAGWRAPSWR